VYAIYQLGTSNKIYVYGANGITILIPNGIYFGSHKTYNIGVKNKLAVLDVGGKHYFVNEQGDLFMISEDGKGTNLGYKEFLFSMDDIVLSYDSFNKMLYICDGTIGYVYSEDSGCLSQGQHNITSMHYQDGTHYVGAPDVITIPDFEVVTDVYDMGTQKPKTVRRVIVGANNLTNLVVSIDYKVGVNDAWSTTPEIPVGLQGICAIPCYGIEFRFRVKGNSNDADFRLESIVIEGQVHNYHYLDTVAIKG
jgi:hypothetical protein